MNNLIFYILLQYILLILIITLSKCFKNYSELVYNLFDFGHHDVHFCIDNIKNSVLKFDSNVHRFVTDWQQKYIGW